MWAKKNRTVIKLSVLILVAPLIIGILYALPVKQIIQVESGDLLSYYATAFGIFVSFLLYREEVEKSKKERISELKPCFIVNVTESEKEGIFIVKIIDKTERPLTYLYLYDRFVSVEIDKESSFRVSYLRDNLEELVDFNITMDDEILDDDGYPKYVQILCDDIDGNMWNSCYFRIKEGMNSYYNLRERELV